MPKVASDESPQGLHVACTLSKPKLSIHELPTEVLERVFLEYVFDDDDDAPGHLGAILLVCQSWSSVASRFEFARLELHSNSKVDRLFARLGRTQARSLPRAGPIQVTIVTQGRGDVRRFGELFEWMQSSVKRLVLGRNNVVQGKGSIIEALEATTRQHPLFPSLQQLSLTEFRWNEVSAILNNCDHLELKRLVLSHGLGSLSLLQTLRLPSLQYLEIKSETYEENGYLDSPMQSNWRFFLRAAPAVECLAICIREDTISWLVDFLRKEAPVTMKKLKASVKVSLGPGLLDRADDAVKNLVDLAKERDWEIWIRRTEHNLNDLTASKPGPWLTDWR